MTNDQPRRFVVIGAGGTGGYLLDGLTRMAEYRLPGSMILIVDGDTFEPSNRERQTFDTYGNKAMVKSGMLGPLYPRTTIVGDPRWVVETSDDEQSQVAANDLLLDGDVVYTVVDNVAARATVFAAATSYTDIDVFTGGNDDALFGSTYHYQRRGGENVTDPITLHHDDYIDPPDRNPGALSCAERAAIEGSTQTIAANMAVAAYLLGRTHKLVLEGSEDTEAEIMFDLGHGLAQPYDRRHELVPVLTP